MAKSRFHQSCDFCNASLDKTLNKEEVNYEELARSLSRVIAISTSKKCKVLSSDPGLIEFVVGVIHYKLVFSPVISPVLLFYRHLDGGENLANSDIEQHPGDWVSKIVSVIRDRSVNNIISPMEKL